MTVLYIDTCSSRLNLGIVKDSQLIDEIDEELGKELSSSALYSLEKMLNKNKIEIDMIDKIIVVNGPGSFTGIRIGVTIAKTLAWSKNIPIATISSLEAFFFSFFNYKTKYLIPVIDARRGYVYASVFDLENKKTILKEQYIELRKVIEISKGLDDYIFISNDSLDLKPLEFYKPDILEIIKNSINRENLDPHLIDANYLKITEAEEKNDI